jgi:uncharacterized protein (DUF302 family)
MSAALGFTVELAQPFTTAIEQVTAALKEEGFGVLTRIDVHDAMREKLGKEFRPYTILGACNPKLAYRALSARPEVGLLLPCNVTVEAVDETRSLVRIVNPLLMMNTGGLDSDETVAGVGQEAHERLQRVYSALGG